MSKKYRNYSHQYNRVNENDKEDSSSNNFVTGVTIELNSEIEPECETNTASTEVIGTVIKCKALNIREEADIRSDIVCVIPVGSNVMIDTTNYSGEWFKVCTEAGLEGYCLSEFVSIDM